MPGDQPVSEYTQRIAAARRTRIVRRVFWTAAVVIIAAGGAFGLIYFVRQRTGSLPGTVVPDQGRQHVALGTPFEYNSNPPTSGPHFASPSEWGIYGKEVADQILIHNLEHGGVWISYRPGVAAGTVERLESIAREFGRKVIMAPRGANDSDIALAAWGRIDKFSEGELSEERVRAFIRAWRNKGPEFVP